MTNFSILNEWGIARLVCTPRILVGVSLKAGVTSLRRRTLEALSWRLTVFAGGYVASDGEGLPPFLTLLLMMMEMVATGPGLGLLPMSPFRMMGTVIINWGVRVHLAKVWARLLTKSLNHCLHIELKGENFLGGLPNQRTSCIMAEWTMWSTLATSTKEWLFTLRMRSWCAKCSHPVWGLWWWDGLTASKKILLAHLRSLLGCLGLFLWLAVR